MSNENKENKENKKSKFGLLMYFLILIGVLEAYFLVNNLFLSKQDVTRLSHSDFMYMVENDEIDEITLNLNSATFIFENKQGKKFEATNPRTDDFKLILLENGIEVNEKKNTSFLITLIPSLLYLAVLIWFVLRMQKGKILKMDKKPVQPTETFECIAGQEGAKKDLKDRIDFIVNPDRYVEVGAKTTKGALLIGPPGTGKTQLVKALAGETKLPLYSFSGSDFVELYVGLGASRIREVFKEAKEHAPAIIFIDEIDMIGSKRETGIYSNNDEKDQTLTALLTEINEAENIYIIGATNRAEVLDSALTRPGRLSDKIIVNNPSREDREQILKHYMANKKFTDDIDMDYLIKMTTGWSGAAIENLLNEAAILCGRDNRTIITYEDIRTALTKVLTQGYTREGKEPKDVREVTAWHEAGHALVTKLLTTKAVTEVSILPTTSGIGGYTMSIPSKENFLSKEDLLNEIKVLYAGRAAEEIHLGNANKVTTGASNDIKVATQHIQEYICLYGMGKRGMLDLTAFSDVDGEVLNEATELANKLYAEVKNLLKMHVGTLNLIAETLLKQDVIDEIKLDSIIQNRKVRPMYSKLDTMPRLGELIQLEELS